MIKLKNFNLSSILWTCIAISVLLLGSGCATNRGILDVKIDVPQSPSAGKTVTIVRVTDIRQFEVAPSIASVPSLKADDIEDSVIKARALARKRNSYGKAIGDIVLPEGRTVEDLVKEALTRAFIEAGYRVVDDTGASKNVIPVEADIEQFWSWMTPGFWTLSLDFEAKIKITGNIKPFKNGETVRGHVQLHTQSAGTRQWLKTINQGIDNFVQEVKKRLMMQ